MSRIRELPPSAAALLLSLRDIGYSVETAVADLVDNSITAGASNVSVFCPQGADPPYLLCIDNGAGMNEDELISAMKHGGAGPNSPRDPRDLGRFGLGLKTASFSQCKKLTVVSARDGKTCGAQWDLTAVEKQDRWDLMLLDDSELADPRISEHLSTDGTVVLWEDLDRIIEDTTGREMQEIIGEKINTIIHHLSIVFHRFLSGETRIFRKMQIEVNGHPIKPFDPFCRANPATQRLPKETVHLQKGSTITIQPYVLPHHSKLSAQEYDFYKTTNDFFTNQGAYVYRNDRLMVWGDWFRLIPKCEATKLARISIDFSPELDEAWAIDIKKSRAIPPFAVRERMRQLVVQLSQRSADVHRHRGAKLHQEGPPPLWNRVATNDRIAYQIDKSHPLIAGVLAKSPSDLRLALDGLLDALASSLPVQAIYSDFAINPKSVEQTRIEYSQTETERKLKALLSVVSQCTNEQLLSFVQATGLYQGEVEELKQFVAEKDNGYG